MKHFLRDESGMTMALVVIMIVLIGVMGAGLLTFVQRDLEAVVEVNQGQRALEMSDAGIEAGKTQLLLDGNNERYNGGGDLDGDGVNLVDSEWSYTGTGKTLNLNGDTVKVTIRYLTPATTADQTKDLNYAPQILPAGDSRYQNGRDFFKITSHGSVGDANRRVEAIYSTRSIGFPPAYFATGNITFNGNAFSIDDVSVFSEAKVINLRGDQIGGCDLAFGNWNRPPWNTVARSATSGTRTRDDGSTCVGYATGVASESTIDYVSGASGRPGIIDYDNYDGNNDGSTSRPDFVNNTWTESGGTQEADDITYPFNPDETVHVDLETLRAAAQSGQNGSKLVTRPPGEQNFRIEDYPANSNQNTVYYVEFSNPNGTFTTTPGGSTAVAKGSVSYSSDAVNPKGTIVVVNGDFNGSPSSKTFEGVVLMRDPVDTDSIRMEYNNNGNFDLQGFVNVEGLITISGSADSDVTTAVINARRAGTYRLDRWSWRECYDESCN